MSMHTKHVNRARLPFPMFSIVVVVVLILGGIGWVKNIIKLSNCDFEAPYKAEVIHAVGIIPPVGAITGWLDLGE